MTRRFRITALALLCGGLLAGCGQKGPLYLPDEGARDIVTRPAPGAEGSSTTAPNTPQTVDKPQEPASPAPEVTAPAPDKDKKDQGAKPQH